MCAKKWNLSDLNGDNTASSVGLVPWRLLVSGGQQKWLKYTDVTEETLTSLNRASIPVVTIWVSDGLTRASCMICLDSEARHLKQRPFSGHVINVIKNTGAGYSPIISIHCVNVAISKTSITFKSVFFIRCRRSDSSIFDDKWNLTAATIARSFSQRPQAAIRELRTWPRIHVQPRFQWGFRNGVTFLRVVYGHSCTMRASLLLHELCGFRHWRCCNPPLYIWLLFGRAPFWCWMWPYCSFY